MDKVMSRTVLLVGTILYLALGALALMTYVVQVEFFSFVSLGIVAQIAVGLPMLAFLFGKFELPVLAYAKWLLVMSIALAISGYLGVPRDSAGFSPRTLALEAEVQQISASDLGSKEIAELMVDMAEAEDDDDKKEIKKKIDSVKDDISKEERKEAEREIAVLKAKAKLASLSSTQTRLGVFNAERRAGIMLMAAFLIFAGAWLMDREQAKAA